MRAALGVLMSTGLLLAQTTLAPEVIQLAQAERKIAQQLAHLPDYTCLETITRAKRRSPSRPLQKLDTVQLEVALIGGKEFFAWPGSRQFEAQAPSQIVRAGLTSNGDFANHVRNLFVTHGAMMHFAGKDEVAGRPSLRYDYQISSLLGRYVVRFADQQAASVAHGSFWLDAETLDLEQITTMEDDLPQDFPVRQSLSTIRYGRVQWADKAVLLPQSARLVMVERTGEEEWNDTEFTHCRQYGAQAVLSFDEKPTASATSAPPQEIESTLPAGLKILAELAEAIDSRTAQVGDLITARTTAAVKQKGMEVIPKGAVLSGRLRRCEPTSELGPHVIFGLEFSEVTWEGHRARFLGMLKAVQPLPGLNLTSQISSSNLRTTQSNDASQAQLLTQQTLTNAELPGVGTFFCAGKRCELPAGFRMEWETRKVDH